MTSLGQAVSQFRRQASTTVSPHTKVWAARFDCQMHLLVVKPQQWVSVSTARPMHVHRDMLRANEAEHVVLIALQLASWSSRSLFTQHQASLLTVGHHRRGHGGPSHVPHTALSSEPFSTPCFRHVATRVTHFKFHGPCSPGGPTLQSCARLLQPVRDKSARNRWTGRSVANL